VCPRVLVVDDSVINQKVALRFLKKYGLPAEAVGDGAQALHRLYPLHTPASALSPEVEQNAGELRGEASQKGAHTRTRDPVRSQGPWRRPVGLRRRGRAPEAPAPGMPTQPRSHRISLLSTSYCWTFK